MTVKFVNLKPTKKWSFYRWKLREFQRFSLDSGTVFQAKLTSTPYRRNPLLTHFSPMSHFYTPLKMSETIKNHTLSGVFRGYRNVTLE